MPSVSAAYQSAFIRTQADVEAEVPLPDELTITLGVAPAAGDVVVFLWGYPNGDHTATPDTHWVDRMLDPGAITGAGLGDWQRLCFYRSDVESGDDDILRGDIATTASPSAVGGAIHVYACRATGSATAGTLTAQLAWSGAPDEQMTSVGIVVLVISGLPDLGEDLSFTLLPRVDSNHAYGQYGPHFVGTNVLTAAQLPSDPAATWNQPSQVGPGYSNDFLGLSGYEAGLGQLIISATMVAYAEDVSAYGNLGTFTALPSLTLGEWETGSPDAAMLVQYAVPTVTGRYGTGLETDADVTTFFAETWLVFGSAPTVRDGLLVDTGLVPMTGSALGYHASAAYQEVRIPPGASADDLCVLILADRYLPSLPAGWTTHRVVSGTNQSARLAWKVLTEADLSAATFSYILAGSGTGVYAIATFAAGSFHATTPIQSYVDSITPSITETLPYLAINTGQAVFHFAAGKSSGPGAAISTNGALVVARTNDVDNVSAFYTETVSAETTVNTRWDATVATTGSYKLSFVLATPGGVVYLPPMTNEAALMVAIFDVVPVSPADGEFLLTNAPTLVVLADGDPEPFSVQFQTSATTAFSAVAWSVQLDDQVAGEVAAAVGIPLTLNQTSYWRARAGDGTSWGPWMTPRALNPYLARADAQEYMHENVGAALDVVPYAGEYMHTNVGIEIILSPYGGDYLHLNVGFQVILSRLGGDYMHQYVFIGAPVPHLWFAWLDHGFVNDHVWIYGQGLGTILTEYHASMRILDSNTHLEESMPVFDWSVNPGGAEAYGEDRRVYAGTDGVNPDVNIEVTIVEVTIPTGVATPTAIVDYLLARTDGGVSNQLAWLLYPLIPLPVGVAQGTTRSAAALRVSTGQPAALEIEQLHATFSPQAVTVLGGMLERAPQTLVTASSTFTFGGVSDTADLSDPVDTPIPLAARWRGLAASVEARPDLGTGVSLWTPVSGSTNAWRIVTGTEPYVDEAFAVMSREDRLGRPAMIFPGDAYAELEEALPDYETWPRFTFAMVAVLHPTRTGSGGDFDELANQLSSTSIFSTLLDTSQPAGTFPMSLVLAGSQVTAKFGPNLNNFISLPVPSDYLGQRPVIISFTTGPRVDTAASTEDPVGRLSILANSLSTSSGAHLKLSTSSRLWLSRDTAPGREAKMDVLEVAVGDALTPAQEVAMISALDGAYGVSRG